MQENPTREDIQELRYLYIQGCMALEIGHPREAYENALLMFSELKDRYEGMNIDPKERKTNLADIDNAISFCQEGLGLIGVIESLRERQHKEGLSSDSFGNQTYKPEYFEIERQIQRF